MHSSCASGEPGQGIGAKTFQKFASFGGLVFGARECSTRDYEAAVDTTIDMIQYSTVVLRLTRVDDCRIPKSYPTLDGPILSHEPHQPIDRFIAKIRPELKRAIQRCADPASSICGNYSMAVRLEMWWNSL